MLVSGFSFCMENSHQIISSVLYVLHCSLFSPYDAHLTRSMDVMPWSQTDRPEDTMFHGLQPKQGILHAFLIGGMESVRPPQTCFFPCISIPRRFTSFHLFFATIVGFTGGKHPSTLLRYFDSRLRCGSVIASRSYGACSL